MIESNFSISTRTCLRFQFPIAEKKKKKINAHQENYFVFPLLLFPLFGAAACSFIYHNMVLGHFLAAKQHVPHDDGWCRARGKIIFVDKFLGEHIYNIVCKLHAVTRLITLARNAEPTRRKTTRKIRNDFVHAYCIN